MSIPGFWQGRALFAAWRTFGRAFILLGLPLLAWGLADYAGFFSEPARVGYALVAGTQALATGWLIYVTPRQAEPEGEYDFSEWHHHIYEVILIVAAYGDRRSVLTWGENPGLRWAGTGLALLATALGFWAGLTWSNHARSEGPGALPDPVLLTEGPFRWIRYPTLVCMAVLDLGFCLLTRSWLGLALMLPLIAILVQRIAFLERRNSGQYGREWRERSETSWRAVPFLY